ncbi:hypothetical protein San01_06430 [Streptomyces angustmyceticus]|uniref:Uncharacterized protein n=1 Tax=Streptomyces angustmyceticus TaxID=285578 RepID=A0A5J4LA27_9ACTN|nr:hypothetical protein San01_06430 [Streptomyces angustmyceticus]
MDLAFCWIMPGAAAGVAMFSEEKRSLFMACMLSGARSGHAEKSGGGREGGAGRPAGLAERGRNPITQTVGL